MFTRILHNSERLCTFFDQLALQGSSALNRGEAHL